MNLIKLPVTLYFKHPEESKLRNLGIETKDQETKEGFIVIDINKIEAFWDYTDTETKVICVSSEYIINIPLDRFENIIQANTGIDIKVYFTESPL